VKELVSLFIHVSQPSVEEHLFPEGSDLFVFLVDLLSVPRSPLFEQVIVPLKSLSTVELQHPDLPLHDAPVPLK